MANAVKVTAYLLYSTAFIILLCTSTTKAEFKGLGSCPTITPVNKFLMGTWYEQRRYDSIIQHSLRCVQYTFGPLFGPLTTLDITAVYKLTGRVFQLHGRLTPVPTGSLNTYAINYNSLNFYPQHFIVLGVPFTTYAVIYSCTNYGFFNLQQAIILTRARIPLQSDIDAAIAVLTSNNLPTWNLKTVDQSLC